MPTTLQSIEYLTTQEVISLLGISRSTWLVIARERGIQHYAQVGKSRRFLWQKSDVDPLLKPIPVGENL